MSQTGIPVFRSLPADRGFWPAVADEALALHGDASEGGAPADLRALDVVLPGLSYAPMLRGALRARLAARKLARLIPPRLHTVASWAGEIVDDTLERRIELFAALRGNDWVKRAFGEQPIALWNLATMIAAVIDELTYAALDGPDAFEARLNATLARHFKQRAARAALPQAQLVLQLWRASLGQGTSTTRLLAALRKRAGNATRPLLFVASAPLQGWTRQWLAALARRVPVRVVDADLAAAVKRRPLFLAAWPELVDAAKAPAPIAARARTIDMVSASEAPTLIEATSLEDEATAIASQVLARLRARRETDAPIALVVLDRIAARRVRALLERARVRVRDETGWKLSTTSAAAVVMRLVDLALDGFSHRDLLDWLKSPFTLRGRAGKGRIVRGIERTIRDQGAGRGRAVLIRALDAGARPALDAADRATAAAWLGEVEDAVARLRTAGPAGAALRALIAAIDGLDMRAALAADVVGRDVLLELDGLLARLNADRALGGVRVSPAEFRALVGARFEEVSFTGETLDSPVVMVSLGAAAMRDFGAAVLIGADASRLPAPPPEALFLSRAVRADLGLRNLADAAREQLCELAALLVRTPQVAISWRSKEGDEPRALAPWLARLRAVARAAGADLRPARPDDGERVAGASTRRPAPSAPHRLPGAISATHYQTLVDCPYQFFARYLLGLRALEDVSEEARPTEYGLAVHEVLLRFHVEWKDHDLAAVPDDDLSRSLATHAAAVFDPLLERRPHLFGQRTQFAEMQAAYLAWLRTRLRTGWTFRAAEHEARANLVLDVGGEARTIQLFGRVDRIDARGDDVEVLDYKTTRRDTLAERLRFAGEHVQLPFYGLLLAPQPVSAAFVYLQRVSKDGAEPVGVQPPPQDYALLVEVVRERLRSDLTRIASGAPLPALGNDTTCSYCKMRGLCRRDYWQLDEAPA